MTLTSEPNRFAWNVEGEAPQKILISPYFIFRWAIDAIVPELRRRYNARFVILVSNQEARTDYESLLTEDDSIVVLPSFEDEASNATSPPTDFEAARRNEQKYGINYTRDIIQLDRRLFTKPSGIAPNSIFGEMEPPSSHVTITAINKCFDWFAEFFDEHAFDLMIGWPISYQDACCTYEAQHRGLLVTYPYVAKLGNLAYWASGPFTDGFQHRKAFENAASVELYDPTQLKTPKLPVNLAYRVNPSELYSTRRITYNILQSVYEHLTHGILRLRNGTFFKRHSRVKLRSIIRTKINAWRFYKRYSKICIEDIDKLSEQPFVFFAFHQEPEFSTQAQARMFNDQAAIVRQIAKSLPAGVNLIIKEHNNLGYRQMSFYKDLLSFPNVFLAHPNILGPQLIERCRAAASLRGTVTLEAALWGKPALVFVPDTEFSVLSNVRLVRSLTDLVDCLKDIADPISPETKRQYQVDGSKFRAAVREISFEADPLFTKDGTSPSEDETQRMIDLLIRLNNLYRNVKATN